MNTTQFHIGDKVAVLDEDLKGTITSVEKFVISIEDDDGFIHHYQKNQLVLMKQNHLLNQISFNENIPNKENSKTVKKASKSVKKTAIVIDLHIHQITASNRNMSNFEMLSMQLEIAITELEKAITMKKKRIIFIHGIGQGVLKQRLEIALKKYSVQIDDANYQKYGKGAMEVRIFSEKLNL